MDEQREEEDEIVLVDWFILANLDQLRLIVSASVCIVSSSPSYLEYCVCFRTV